MFYSFFLQLSPSVLDLLSTLLQPDPERRATIDQVLRHPWYLQDLPPGSMELNVHLLQLHQDKAAAEQALAMEVDALVDAAEGLGRPGDPVQAVALVIG